MKTANVVHAIVYENGMYLYTGTGITRKCMAKVNSAIPYKDSKNVALKLG